MRRTLPLLLLVVVILLSACGPAIKPATGPTTDTGEVFTVALPRIVVDFSEDGSPSLLGLNMDTLAALTKVDMRAMHLNPYYINWMQAANVQNLEFRIGGNGVYVLVNGKPLPFISWDDNSLQRASELAGALNLANSDAVRKFLPIVRRLGLDLALRFPKAPGVAEIPLADPNAVTNVSKTASNSPASVVMQFEVKYDQNGTPAILGLTPYDLMSLGIKGVPTNISPAVLRQLQASNIQTLELRSKSDGLYVYVNGQLLPTLAWDDNLLVNASQVYGQMNDPRDPTVQAIKTLLPMVNKADLGILMHFPIAPGKEPIPVKMHQ